MMKLERVARPQSCCVASVTVNPTGSNTRRAARRIAGVAVDRWIVVIARAYPGPARPAAREPPPEALLI